MVMVQSSGDGWWLGAQACRQHTPGSAWFTEYLNREVQPGMRVSGSARLSKFVLCRSVAPRGIEMASYPPMVPLTENAAVDARLAGNAVRMADFAPFKLVNLASAEEVAREAAIDHYPTEPFRANLVVRASKAWAEESWGRVDVLPARPARGASSSSNVPLLSLTKIIECPTPRRDALEAHNLPSRPPLASTVASQWGFWWSGCTFGVYFGHGGVDGMTISVGDRLHVEGEERAMSARGLRRMRAHAWSVLGVVWHSWWHLMSALIALVMLAVSTAERRRE